MIFCELRVGEVIGSDRGVDWNYVIVNKKVGDGPEVKQCSF